MNSTTHPALKMLPAGVRRVICIDVTSRCELRCSNCTRGLPYREKEDMTPENFRLACESLRDWTDGPTVMFGGVRAHRVIAVIGGNPCLSPHFAEYCRIIREVIPRKQSRGLWSNAIHGHGAAIRDTFGFFNLNVHGEEKAAEAIRRELPGVNVYGSSPHRPHSLHSGVFTAIRDFVGTPEIPDEAAMWDRINGCDINRDWSGSIVQIDGRPYAYFCEIAAAFEAVYGVKTGVPLEGNLDWWKWGMDRFAEQSKEWCPKCGIPLKLRGHEDHERTDDFSKSHAGLVQLAVKRKQNHVMHDTLPDDRAALATDYQRLVTPDADPVATRAKVRRLRLTDVSPAPPAAAPPLRLNLGGGTGPLIPGYEVVDRKVGKEVYPLDYPDGSAEVVRASHVLEHLSFRKTVDAVKDWVRVLSPGGVLKIAVPNFEWCVANAGDSEHPIEAYLMGGQSDADDYHAALFNGGKLRRIMELAGLTGIVPWVSEVNDCASLEVSLNLQGTKPGPAADKNPPAVSVAEPETPPPPAVAAQEVLVKVSAVMSAPRLCFTDNFASVEAVVREMGIPCRIRQGVFWGPTLTRAIELTLAEDAPDAVLFIDYDSVFSKEQVHELVRLLIAHPEADAVAACQVGRDRDAVLLTVKGADGKNQARVSRADAEKDLLRLSTAHFGLTAIRSSSFAKLGKPWFQAFPDANGEWGEGKIDEDIFFWRQAERAGWNVFQANKVRIGHLQLMVSWPTPEFLPVHQYVTDYRKDGPPAECK